MYKFITLTRASDNCRQTFDTDSIVKIEEYYKAPLVEPDLKGTRVVYQYEFGGHQFSDVENVKEDFNSVTFQFQRAILG